MPERVPAGLRPDAQPVRPATDGNPYKAVPFSFRATGGYPQLVKLLRDLESGPRLLRIKTFNFSRGEQKTNALVLDLTVDLLGSQ